MRTALILPSLVLLACSACVRAPSAVARNDASSGSCSVLPRGAVIYGVIPPLFGDQQAPFQAVTARLDALKDQGVDAIWLSPVNQTDDSGAINYSVTDYFRLRPDFGTEAQFRTLISEAHRRGIKVLMDFVPNHTSSGHPFFKDAVEKGAKSPYWTFYDRNPDGEATHYFDWAQLKNLNYSNPEVQKLMTDAFTYWVREFDIDGYRIDAAWGVKDRNSTFWPTVVSNLRAIKPGIFLLAEASARDPYYVRHSFDAAYDWTDQLGRWAWEGLFDEPGRIGERLHHALTAAGSPPDRVVRFLNNNDTGERFISRHGLPMTRLAAVLQHTVPGIPLVYTGDEVAAEYEPYEDPPALSWQDPNDLRSHYRRLARLRENTPALHSGSFQSMPLPHTPSTYAFLRDAGGADKALVVLNFGKSGQDLALAVPSGLARSELRDALTGDLVPVQVTNDGLRVRVPAMSAYVLSPPEANLSRREPCAPVGQGG